jgi:uncharacterized protein
LIIMSKVPSNYPRESGKIAAEIFRRSGSVWPAVIVHVVVNLPTIPVMVAAGAG